MGKKQKKSEMECVMKCPDCSHKMNVCRIRRRGGEDQEHTCPGCGATLVPLDEKT